MSSFVPRIPTSRDESPFINQTPTEILSRERLVFQKNYSASEVTLMNVINPKLWASVNANEGCLRTFRYARWKAIKYRVVVQSNPFLYGYFTLTCLPNDKRRHNNALALSDYGWFSHDDCLIVDITSMPESQLTVPWLSNNTWVDLEKWSSGLYNVEQTLIQLNGLKILYDNTIGSTSSTVPKTFSISVFMQFIDPEVSCPISPGATSTAKFATHQAQMMNVAGVFGTAAASYAFDAVQKKTMKGFESLVDAGVEKVGEAATNFVFGGEEGQGVEFGISEDVPSEPAPCAISVEEGSAHQPQEIIPSVFGGMNYSASRNTLGTGTMLLKNAGRQNSLTEFLQKPSLVNRTVIVAGAGTVFQPDIWNGRDVHLYFTDLPTCSRLRYLAQFFRFWRGSITYTFFFISSPMVTFRFKIALDYQGGTLAGIDPGDTLQSIVTVRGTTVHQVTVPYLYTTPWQFIGDGDPSTVDIIPTISVSEFSVASKSGDTTPSVFLLVYESANRDFVFTSHQEPMPYAASPAIDKVHKQMFQKYSVHEAQMDIRKFRSQDMTQFGRIDPVRFSSDGVGTFEALAKRWSPSRNYGITRPFYYDTLPYQSSPLVSSQTTLEAICGIFYWQRGQVKLKVSFKVDETTDASGVAILKMGAVQPVSLDPSAGLPAAVRFSDGASAISYDLTQVLEATVPFLCTTEWIECSRDFAPTTGAFRLLYQPEIWSEGPTLPPDTNFIATSAGRDFCYSYNLPPPYFGARWYDCVPYIDAKSRVMTTPQNLRSRMSAGNHTVQ